MTENEFLLEDRIAKIKSTIEKYGEDKFYIAYSGGKDSTVLSYLVDMAVPGNTIPRVYSNTGIEYKLVLEFVKREREHPWELVVLKPQVPIKQMLEKEGYPFKSKQHAAVVASYQSGNKDGKWVKHYLEKEGRFACPHKLKYQFTDECNLKISDKCCYRMKEEPMFKWRKENNRPYGIVGVMREEGGRRSGAKCMVFVRNKLTTFQPLVAVSKEWEDWFISKYNIKLSDIYYPPYNFKRTGCKGCPFDPYLQKDLFILDKFFPNERKQCEIIWKPVYDEYRRIGYRLKSPYENDHVEGQLAFTDIDMNVAVE